MYHISTIKSYSGAQANTLLKNVYFNLFIWLRCVSVAAHGIFDLCCSVWESLGTTVLVLQWCPILCNSTDCSPPGSSVHGILQARILEWVAISFSRGIFPAQGLNPGVLHCIMLRSSCLTRDWTWTPCTGGMEDLDMVTGPPGKSPDRLSTFSCLC